MFHKKMKMQYIIYSDDSIDYNWIEHYPNKVDWTDISINGKLKNKFIRKYKDYVNWYEIGIHQKLNYDTMFECGEYLDWNVIVEFQFNISEDLLLQYRDRMTENCWSCFVPRYQKLSRDFIQKYLYSFDLISLIKYQRLSEQQIKLCCQLNLGKYVSKYQRLKPKLICNLKSELDWKILCRNPYIDVSKFNNHEIISIKPYIKEMFDHRIFNFKFWIFQNRLWELEYFTRTIQKYWKRAIADPKYKLCKLRLEREFAELLSIT